MAVASHQHHHTGTINENEGRKYRERKALIREETISTRSNIDQRIMDGCMHACIHVYVHL